MIRTAAILTISFFIGTAYADNCAAYKMRPTVNIDVPDWTKSVVQPLEPMQLWHGNVVATMVENYDLIADITSVEDGFCVSLKTVNATVGYSDFLVQIDMRHSPDTCGYDAVLLHEDGHINAYLSVIDDYSSQLRSAVQSAADSVMPVFVEKSSMIENAIESLNKEIQAYPDIVLIKQKINASVEMRNKRIDKNDDGTQLKRCYE